MPTSFTMFPPRRPTGVAMAAVLGSLLPGAVAMGQTPTGGNAPPASAFDIIYYAVDEDGDRGRQLTVQDLEGFVNQARCACGQPIEAKITLRTDMGTFDNVQIRTFVGNQCDIAQVTQNPQALPCVKVIDEFTNAYTKSISVQFHPIWLAFGVEGTSQSISDAIPAGDCEGVRGDAGIWICVENGMQPDCQQDEFIVTGTQNLNTPMGESQAITFDFDAPRSVPTDFEIQSGDEAVVIDWELEATGDINGFRVLCADANGDPLPDKGFELDDITDRNLGTAYFTEDNLCPGGPFTDVSGELIGGGDEEGTGTGTGGTTGGDFTTTGTDGTTTVATGTTGPPSRTDTGTNTTAATSGTTGGGASLPGSGIESLDWDFVCTDHLPFNTESARVSGLENGQEFQFLVVAYDRAGNPVPASPVLRAVPRNTFDLWEQCEEKGDICGDGGFCACRSDDPRPMGGLAALAGLMLGIGGVLRRRRRRTR